MVLTLGFLAMLACLAFQALASLAAAQYFAWSARRPWAARSSLPMFRQFGVLMILLMIGNILQIGLWAVLYRMFDLLPDWETAVYFSGVTFTSLGYGDVVLEGRARLLGPLQAANGLMMFGTTTAVFIAAVQRGVEDWIARHPPDATSRP